MRPLIQIKLCPLQTLKGYECTKTLIATLLRGLKGLKMYKAGVALKRKIAFPRFNTMKVWKRDRTALVQICITLLTSVLAVLPCASRRHKTELKWHFMNLRVLQSVRLLVVAAFVHVWLVITAERTKLSRLCSGSVAVIIMKPDESVYGRTCWHVVATLSTLMLKWAQIKC